MTTTMQPQLAKDASVLYWLTPLTPWLKDDAITEIAINQPNEVWIEKNNEWQRFDIDFSYDNAIALATAVAAFTNNDISTLTPRLSATLTQGERIQCVIPPMCSPGTVSITIRKPSKRRFSLVDYQQSGFFSKKKHQPAHTLHPHDDTLLRLKNDGDLHGFVCKAIEYQKTIVVAGDTGSGKTAFMQAMIDAMPSYLRIITIEDVAELILPYHPNHVHLFYPSEALPHDPVTPAAALKSCLRMKPDRILIGELRGGETFDFINVALAGHDGNITSIHAKTATLAFERMALMAMQNPQAATLPYDMLLRLLHQVIDVVIHVKNDTHSSEHLGRHITSIYFHPEGLPDEEKSHLNDPV